MLGSLTHVVDNAIRGPEIPITCTPEVIKNAITNCSASNSNKVCYSHSSCRGECTCRKVPLSQPEGLPKLASPGMLGHLCSYNALRNRCRLSRGFNGEAIVHLDTNLASLAINIEPPLSNKVQSLYSTVIKLQMPVRTTEEMAQAAARNLSDNEHHSGRSLHLDPTGVNPCCHHLTSSVLQQILWWHPHLLLLPAPFS